MSRITAGQSRVLSHLYFHKPGNVDITLADLMKNQGSEAEETLDLLARGLVEINKWTEDGPSYVSLTRKGEQRAGWSLPSVIHRLGEMNGRPCSLYHLITGGDSFTQLAQAQEAGLIEAMMRNGSRRVDLTRLATENTDLDGWQVAVKLTRRGQEYLAR